MDIIEQARQEWVEDGLVSTSTVARMYERGFDAEAIIDNFEENDSVEDES